MTHQMIRSWMVDLSEKKLASNTIRRKVSTLRSFYKYMVSQGMVDSNPMKKLGVPKVGHPLPKYVPQNDLLTLFTSTTIVETANPDRDRLLMKVLYATGLRVSELCDLRVGSIDNGLSGIRVIGKGQKYRIVPVSEPLLIELNAWCDKVTEESDNQRADDYLFKLSSGKKMYPRLVYRIVKHYLSQVTTLNQKSPHILRHSFATHLMDEGAELVAIKELLGHTSLAATQVYTHTSLEKVQRIYKQAHPRATKRKE